MMKKGYVIPLKEEIAFGSGDAGVNLAFDAINFYMLWFIVNVGAISPGMAGIIFLVAKVWDAVTDYFMGRISDNTNSSMGRRRPYIMLGAIPFGLFFMAIWYVPELTEMGRFTYYLIIYIIFNTAYTIVAVLYGSLMSQMTHNYDERTVLSSFRVGFSFIGTLLAAAGIPLITDVIFGHHERSISFLYMGIIFGMIMIYALWQTGYVSTERVEGNRKNYEGFFTTIASFFKNDEFRNVTGMYLFNSSALAVVMALAIFYLGDVLKIKGDAAIYMAIPIITALLLAPVWTFFIHKYGKKISYVVGAIYMMIALCIGLLIPAGNTVMIVGFLILLGGGLAACQIIPMSILPDIIDVDEYENRIRREGAFNGIISFFNKAASGFAVGGVGLLLGYFGYVEANPDDSVADIVQPDSAITAVRVIIVGLPIIFFIISIIFASRSKLNKENFTEIISELEARRETNGQTEEDQVK